MGSIVKCPKCAWRGFRSYFPKHFDSEHLGTMYTDAIMVDQSASDSRPRIGIAR